jgi:hypothetical protein
MFVHHRIKAAAKKVENPQEAGKANKNVSD